MTGPDGDDAACGIEGMHVHAIALLSGIAEQQTNGTSPGTVGTFLAQAQADRAALVDASAQSHEVVAAARDTTSHAQAGPLGNREARDSSSVGEDDDDDDTPLAQLAANCFLASLRYHPAQTVSHAAAAAAAVARGMAQVVVAADAQEAQAQAEGVVPVDA